MKILKSRNTLEHKNILPADKKKDHTILKTKHIFRIIVLLFIILIFGSLMTFLYYMNFVLLEHKEIQTSVMVGQFGNGLNADPDSLVYGKNHPGGWAQRSFDVYSPVKSRVRINAVGNISNMISFSNNDFILEPNITTRVFVDVNIPEDAILGNYSGKIKIYILKY